MGMSGREIRALVKTAGLTPEQVCVEAGVSMGSLYKVYNDKNQRPATRLRVIKALKKLVAEAQSQPA